MAISLQSLCLLHGLRCLGDRAWTFLLPLFLASVAPGNLAPSAGLEAFRALGRLLLVAPVASWFSEQKNRGLAFIYLLAVEHLAVLLLGGGLVWLDGGVAALQELNLLYLLFGLLAAVDAAISNVLNSVICKDLVVDVALGESAMATKTKKRGLETVNAAVTAVDLVMAAAAPLAVGALWSFGTKTSGPRVVVCGLVVWQVLAACVSAVIVNHEPDLGASTQDRASDDDDKKQRDLSARLVWRRTLSEWRKLPYETQAAMVAMALLFCTVMSGGSSLTSWLATKIDVASIAIFRSATQIAGFAGTAAAPLLIRELGPHRTALVGVTWQACCVSIAAIAFFLASASSSPDSEVRLLLFAVVLSRYVLILMGSIQYYHK